MSSSLVNTSSINFGVEGYKKLSISNPALEYLLKLFSIQDDDIVGLCIYIKNPGTLLAEPIYFFCKSNEVNSNFHDMEFHIETPQYANTSLHVYVDTEYWDYLNGATLEYTKNQFGGELKLMAPNANTGAVSVEHSIEERIRHLLLIEINPVLASHGGEVFLENMDDKYNAVIRFGGGCQGCGAVDFTLKHSVEKILLENIPELNGVLDWTDHSDKSNAYI